MSADLSLRQLQLVIQVATLGSFTRAAEELLLSQPALSRTIRDVEHRTGARLFDRTTRSVQLTTEGTEFIATAKAILQAYDDNMGRFARYQAGLTGDLTIAALPSVTAHLLTPVVVAFLTDRPGIRLRILDGNTTEVLDLVRSGAADLAITATQETSQNLQQDNDLDVIPLLDDPVVAVLPPSHRLTSQPTVTWADLADEPIIAFAEGSSLRLLADAAFQRASITPRRFIEAHAVGAAAAMIAAGLGIGIATQQVFPLMSFVELTTRTVTQPEASRTLNAVTRKRPALSPAARDFLQLLLHHRTAGYADR